MVVVDIERIAYSQMRRPKVLDARTESPRTRDPVFDTYRSIDPLRKDTEDVPF